jgi:hypothetical protein
MRWIPFPEAGARAPFPSPTWAAPRRIRPCAGPCRRPSARAPRPRARRIELSGRACAQHDDGLDGLAAIGVLHGDDAGLLDVRMLVEHVLDLRRPDFVAAGIDHALEAIGDEEVAVLVDASEIARAKESLAIEFEEHGFGGVGPPPVSLEHRRAMDDDLARLALGHLEQRVRVDHPGVDADVGNAEALQLGGVRRVAVRRRGGFGQSVALDIIQSIEGLQALGHRLRHRRPAAADIAQARQIEAREIRAAQQVDDHRGNVDPGAHLVARDEPPGQFAIPARQQDRGGARADRGVHAEQHAGDVEHRHHPERHVGGADAIPDLRRMHVVADRAMGVHAALGLARGARRVAQGHQVIGITDVVRCVEGVGHRVAPVQRPGRHIGGGPQPALPGRGRGIVGREFGGHRVGVVGHQQPLQPRVGREQRLRTSELRHQIGRADRQASLRIGDVVGELLAPTHGIGRHDDRPQPQQRIERNHVLRRVLQGQHHPIAFAHTGLAVQPAGQPLCLCAQLRKTERTAEEHEGRFVRIAPRRDVQVVPQRGLGSRQVEGHPPRPEAAVRREPVSAMAMRRGRRHVSVLQEQRGLGARNERR